MKIKQKHPTGTKQKLLENKQKQKYNAETKTNADEKALTELQKFPRCLGFLF